MSAARDWAVGLVIIALTAVGLAVEFFARSSGFWVTTAEVVVMVVFAVSAGLMWLNQESRGNAMRLGLAGAIIGLAAMESPAFWLAGGFWYQLGWTFGILYVPLILSVLLAYPSARVSSRSGRLLVAVAWVWALHRLLSGALWDPQRAGFGDDGRWLTLYADHELSRWILDVGNVMLLGILVWFMVLQIRRRQGSGGPMRRTTRLVATVAIALAAVVCVRTVVVYAVVWNLLGEWANYVALAMTSTAAAAAGVILLVVALRRAVRRTAIVERLLAAAGNPAAVGQVLRTELDDPTLQVTFLLDNAWVDAEGRPVADLGPRAPGRIVRELAERDGQPTARIEADESVTSDPGRLRVTLTAAALVLDNTRLTVERNHHLAELAAAQARIIEAGARQRQQLERDLHDGAQQSLLGVAATLSRATLAEDSAQMRVVVDDARDQLSAALAELRQLAHGIHPAVLTQGGLGPALEGLAARLDRVVLRLGSDLRDGRRLPVEVETTAYFVVAEATTNAIKYGHAQAIAVEVRCDDGVLHVAVEDGGDGGAAIVPDGGLAGLADRVRALGGEFGLSEPVDGGTRAWARIPVTEEVA